MGVGGGVCEKGEPIEKKQRKKNGEKKWARVESVVVVQLEERCGGVYERKKRKNGKKWEKEKERTEKLKNKK